MRAASAFADGFRPSASFTPTFFFRLISLFAVTLMLAAPAASRGQSEPEQPMIDFAIEAGSLDQALNQFAATTGLFFSGNGSLTQGKNSPGLQGEMTASAALTRLLEGSQLDFRFTDERTITLFRLATSNDTLLLEPIRVTGENIERSLLDTNTSVDVQGFEELQRSSDTRIQQTFERAANVTKLGVGVTGFNFSVRGINSQGVGAAGDAPLASLTIDGALLTSQQLARGYNSLFDMETVEIFRGPQSTNVGRNSLAGAVVLKTKDPEFHQQTQALASYAEFDTYELGLVNTGPLSNSLAYRVSLNRLSSDGFLENPVVDKDNFSFSETDTARFKLLYAPEHSEFSVLLGHALIRAKARNDVYTYDPDNERLINLNPFLGGMDTDQDVTNLDISYQLSERWALESITTYNDTLSLDINSTFSVTHPDPGQAWVATADQQEVSQELRFTYQGDRLTAVLGYYYADQENTALREGVAQPNFDATLLGFPGLSFDLASDVNTPESTETQALYGEFDYQLNDALTLTLGGRYERVEIDNSNSLTVFYEVPGGTAPFVGPLIGPLTLDADTSDNLFLPKAGLTYRINDNQTLGFTYSEGYRRGGTSIDLLAFQVNTFDPEFVKNYELSYRGQFTNGLSITANLFYMDWTDMQTQGTELINSGVFNAGEASVSGGELEFGWTNEQWDSWFNLGYAKTEFDEFFLNGADLSGNEFPTAPELTASAGAYYNHSDWTLGGEANYREGYYTSVTNDEENPSLTVVNLSATYHYHSLALRLFANNVFDQIALIGQDYQPEAQGPVLNTLSEPRVLGVQIKYGFN